MPPYVTRVRFKRHKARFEFRSFVALHSQECLQLLLVVRSGMLERLRSEHLYLVVGYIPMRSCENFGLTHGSLW